MEGLIVTEVFHWVVNHFPDVAALIFLVAVVAWVAIKINNFGHRPVQKNYSMTSTPDSFRKYERN